MSDNMNGFFPCQIGIVVTSAAQLASVYALLGGASVAALGSGNIEKPTGKPNAGVFAAVPTGAAEQSGSDVEEASPAAATTAGDNALADDGEIDAHGHTWSADLHASTKGKTKEGLWRMKPGATRPDPKPGFPVDEPAAGTGTSSGTDTGSATSQTATEAASGPNATEEDDEFAAFREAAASSDAADKVAAEAVPARQLSDADLGALCNQAAVKLGDPAPIKEIIGRYVPDGEVTHSRNIPADKREDFAKEVEEKAGIEFAG